MPGVQCETCKQAGRETWVIPGKACHVCGTLCGLLERGMSIRGISRCDEALTGCNSGRERIRVGKEGYGSTYNVSFNQERPVYGSSMLTL